MRILLVAHTFMPASVGGTEVHTYQLARDLRARHDVAILYRIYAPDRPEFELTEERYEGLPVYRLVNNFTWSPGRLYEYFCPGAEPRFQQVLDGFRPDVVHFQHLGGGLSTSSLSLAAARGLPTLVTLHDYWCLCPLSQLLTADGERCPGPEGGLRCLDCMRPLPASGGLGQNVSAFRAEARFGLLNGLRRIPGYLAGRALERWAAPWMQQRLSACDADSVVRAAGMARDRYFHALLETPDALLSPSRFLQRVFDRWGVSEDRICFIQNGVEPDELVQPPVPGRGVLRLAFLGAIQPDKGLDAMIDALQELRDEPVELLIYGDIQATPQASAYTQELRKKADGARVSFMGRLPHAQVGRALAEADALVYPSLRYENCPMSILEAQYAGVPVITSNIGGMAELVQHDVSGLQFRVGDAHDLAAQVRRALADGELLPRLRRGIQRPPTTTQVSEAVERIYGRLVELRRQGRHGLAAQRALAEPA